VASALPVVAPVNADQHQVGWLCRERGQECEPVSDPFSVRAGSGRSVSINSCRMDGRSLQISTDSSAAFLPPFKYR
jgi:hypothetical protein